MRPPRRPRSTSRIGRWSRLARFEVRVEVRCCLFATWALVHPSTSNKREKQPGQLRPLLPVRRQVSEWHWTHAFKAIRSHDQLHCTSQTSDYTGRYGVTDVRWAPPLQEFRRVRLATLGPRWPTWDHKPSHWGGGAASGQGRNSVWPMIMQPGGGYFTDFARRLGKTVSLNWWVPSHSLAANLCEAQRIRK